MDYKKHYDLLIARGQRTLIHGYSERHHIIPKCLGGSDREENIVRLTAREHFVAHQLLVKMYPKEKGLIYACHRMRTSGKTKISGRTYRWLKELFRRAVSENQTGRIQSKEARQKNSESHKGKKKSVETRAAMSAAKMGEKNPMYGLEQSLEARQKNSNSNKGKIPWNKGIPHTREYKAAQSIRIKEWWKQRRANAATETK